MILSTIAKRVPIKIALFRFDSGKFRLASAMTIALSPPNTTSIPTIISTDVKNSKSIRLPPFMMF
ncbi:Uncharacterised protein [Streptococcus pneumoniae]|nr:Uncharacterised protein [Streptococcus pneumoniae]